jgi:signal transduction histidine kinase
VDGDRVVLRVADTGIGIPAGHLGNLFQRFARAPAALEQAVQGSGLGLVISRAIAEAHGGRITVASGEGAGSVFEVALPVAPPATQPAISAEAGQVVGELGAP